VWPAAVRAWLLRCCCHGSAACAAAALLARLHAPRMAAPYHRESICMHSGIVNRNQSPGRGALVLSIQPLPGLLTGRKYSAGTHWSTCTRSHGQAVAGSIGPAPPVQGVNFQLLVRGVRWQTSDSLEAASAQPQATGEKLASGTQPPQPPPHSTTH
jgi:hypothetical protein